MPPLRLQQLRGRGAAVAFTAAALLLVAVMGVLAEPAAVGAQDTPDVAPRDVAVSWSVAPGPRPGEPSRPNFVHEAAAGETIEDSLLVTNHGEVALVLGITANDAFNTPEGGMDLLASDEEPEGLGSWVQTDESSVTVAPGDSVTVPFRVVVPEDAPAGDHTGGILTTLTISEPDEDGNRVRYERRLGTRIHLRVDGQLEPALEFTSMTATYTGTPNPFAPGTMKVTYTVENTGNVRLRATQRLVVEGGLGTSTEIAVADMAELLPGNSYSFEHDVPGVWPFFGTQTRVVLQPYSVSGDPTDATAPEIEARNHQSLVPTPQIVLLLILAALIAGGFAWRVRSRARFRAAVDAAVRDALTPSATNGGAPGHTGSPGTTGPPATTGRAGTTGSAVSGSAPAHGGDSGPQVISD